MGNKNPKLSKDDLDFLLKKTSFNEMQIKSWYKGFMVSLDLFLCYSRGEIRDSHEWYQ